MKWLDKLLNRAPAQAPVPTPRKTAPPPEADNGATAPRADDPPEVWIEAICQARDKVLALSWLAELNGDARLGEVATRARNAEVRYAAARRIEDGTVLEQVAQGSRDKDKRVYRHCADLLKQRRQVAASRRRVEEIADELSALLAGAPLPHTPLLGLSKELGTLKEAGEVWTTCDARMADALARLRQESEARREVDRLQSTVAALSTECADAAWPWSERIVDWRGRLDALVLGLEALPAWLAEPAQTLRPLLVEIESRLVHYVADVERATACEAFLATLEVEPVTDPAAAWRALTKPEHAEARLALEQRWRERAPGAPVATESVAAVEPDEVPVAEAPPPKRSIDQEALRALLEQLEQAIGEGHLHDADAVANRIKALLDGQRAQGALESRLQQLQGELEAMRGWARWGTGQAREHLIAAANDLLQGEREVDELARAIPALREEWKRLNTHGAATGAQWKGFDTALEQAYQPVAALRAETEVRQAEARAAREALCAEWEAELAGIDWEQADFKQIEKRRAEWIGQWRDAAKAGHRDERALRKRFDSLIGGIDQPLEAARAAERERREQLIAEADALKEQTDLRRAMNEAKSLNERWSRQPLPVRFNRGEEQKQWQRFRAACDAVFARGDAERDARTAQRREQDGARRTLLDTFATTLASADVGEIRRALAQLNAEWRTHRPDPREGDDGLETRARELRLQAQQRLDQARREAQRAGYELLARKAALAERVEAAVLAAQPMEVVLSAARRDWDALPPLPGDGEHPIAQRLANAADITAAQLAAGRETRAALLLDLEIALGLPSPESHAEARRERQLGRLRDRFGATTSPQSEPETLLIRCHATAALADTALDQRLAAVTRYLAEMGEQETGG